MISIHWAVLLIGVIALPVVGYVVGTLHEISKMAYKIGSIVREAQQLDIEMTRLRKYLSTQKIDYATPMDVEN